MDFWSRLIGGARASSSPKNSRNSTPSERLTAFKRACHTLQQIWRTSTSPSNDWATIIQARECIEQLNVVLGVESRGPAPHPCLTYASTSQVYIIVTKLALTYHDEQLTHSVAIFFNTLIDTEIDGVVDNRIFSRALIDLVKRANVETEEVDGRLVELLFGVANNIRLRPQILPAWFFPKQSTTPTGDKRYVTGDNQFEGATRRDDFPLFYSLVDYVHRDGRPGDFARTGLLYIIETAAKAKDLEKWLIESDLATLMAIGLGATYSQLSRHLAPSFLGGKVPPIIAYSDELLVTKPMSSPSPSQPAQVDAFLSYLLFWQDTIDHCPSVEVKDTLLDHFQVLFLQQLLYPSLLESSDVAGGSTSAVLAYLYRVLEVLQQPELVHRILHFLLASPIDPEPVVVTQNAPRRKNVSLSRRKSMDILAAFAEEAAKPSPSLFNLVDLILMSVKSHNRDTLVSTLKLLTVILRRHHTYASSVIKTIKYSGSQVRLVGTLNVEIRHMLSLATSIVDDPSIDESYENYIKDAKNLLESRLIPILPTDRDCDGPESYILTLRTDDSIFKEILFRLETFFSNSVVVNLALTETLISLASSDLLTLEGWLLTDQSKYERKTGGVMAPAFASTELSGDRQIPPEIGLAGLDLVRQAYIEPAWSVDCLPPLLAVLQKLVSRVQLWRQDISDFDFLIGTRRTLLKDDIEDAGTSRSASRQPPLTSTNKIPVRGGTSSNGRGEVEPNTPRGRSLQPTATTSSPISSSPSTSKMRSAVGSPLRESVLRPTDPRTPDSRTSSNTRSVTTAEDLHKRLSMPFIIDEANGDGNPDAGEVPTRTNDVLSEGATIDEPSTQIHEHATLGHVLTNIVVLYEFILELTAMVQMRAIMFQETGYTL